MSRVSKADEATSWRRQTPLQGGHSAFSSSKHSNHTHRPATAGGNHQSKLQQVQAQQYQYQLQQHAPWQPAPAVFDPVEAQANLEQRWISVCQNRLQPTAQCKQQSAQEHGEQQAAAEAVIDGVSHAGSSFLHALKKAMASADEAWNG